MTKLEYFIAGMIAGAIAMGIAIYTIAEPVQKTDYTLELDDNSMYINDKYGNMHTIRPEELEEFIDKDNL